MAKADIDESGDIDETEFVAFVRTLQKDRKKNPDLNLRDACIALDKKRNQHIGKGQNTWCATLKDLLVTTKRAN